MSQEVTQVPAALLPLLIYDGDCEFCAYWAFYWQKLTGNSVLYQPYQAVQDKYPEIPLESFKKAIQYIAPDGKIASAAEASYLTLSHAPGKGFWLSLYRQLPGFAWITERAYSIIAAHRSFFYTLTLLLWGRNYEPPRYDLVAWLFLRGMGCIFLIAFFSFATQAAGLIGSHGIIPVTDLTHGALAQLGSISYWVFPMVFWLNSSDLAIQVVCTSGIVFSLLLIVNRIPRISLIMLYILYTSLSSAGQFFMSFQWDMFLLEAGILSLFLFGWTKTTGIWLLRWLLFRFIFAAGMVKIMSGDPTWQNLTALSYYFNTEPLPTPLAWYAAQLPETFLKFSTGAALFIELVIPFFIFLPRRLRFLAAFSILFMQILISLTGNYNFFNLQTMLLCLVLFDDLALKTLLPVRFTQPFQTNAPTAKSHPIASASVTTFVIVTVLLSLIGFFLRFGNVQSSGLVMAYNMLQPLRIVNNYGPFAIITTFRHEIIFEGSNDGNTWTEYRFKYKPGDVNKPLRWNIPLQPRLDWQMWFAALGTLEQNRWLINVSQRLLENSQPVIDLLENNPFPDKPPVYLRAQLYDYHFTTSAQRAETGAIWNRNWIGTYVPQVHLNNAPS